MKKRYLLLFLSIIHFLSLKAQKIIPPGLVQGELLGHSVSVFGNVAVAGAPADDLSGTSDVKGAAYIFEKINNQWVFKQKITANDGEPGDAFGASVSTDGTSILVGAPLKNGPGSSAAGAAYLFQKQCNQWIQADKFTPPQTPGVKLYGFSVSVSGNLVAVGMPMLSFGFFQNAGGMQTFLNLNGWLLQGFAEPNPGLGNQFGRAVSVHEKTLVTSAIRANAKNQFDTGRIYRFEKNNAIVSLDKDIEASDAGTKNFFGWDISVFKDFIMVGTEQSDVPAAGKAYIYNPKLEETILLPEANKGFFSFGEHCAMGENLAVLTSMREQNGINDSYAHVFEFKNDVWTEKTKFKTDGGIADTLFGTPALVTDVAIAGTDVMIGSSNDAEHGINAGAVYFYDAGVVNTPPQLTIPAAVIIDEDMAGDVNFTVSDAETLPNNLKVKIISKDPDLILPSELLITGNGGNKVLHLKSTKNGNGNTVLKVVVEDEQGYTDEKLVNVTVNPVNDPPIFNLSKENILLDGNIVQEETLQAVLDFAFIPSDEFGENVTYSIKPLQADFASVFLEPVIIDNNKAAIIHIKTIPGKFGAQEFTVKADDGKPVNNTFERKFTLQVKGTAFFPNPASKTVFFKAIGTNSDTFQLTFTDERGIVCKQVLLKAKNQVVDEKLDLSDLAVGIYFVNISGSAGEHKQVKFIKN